MHVKFSELRNGQTFYGRFDTLGSQDAFFKIDPPKASAGMTCDLCGSTMANNWNAKNLETGSAKHFCPDETIHILPILYPAYKESHKWHMVCGFRTLPAESPKTAKPDQIFAKFTCLSDALSYAQDLMGRPTMGQEYHLIVVK
jgi:hypothetical protein